MRAAHVIRRAAFGLAAALLAACTTHGITPNQAAPDSARPLSSSGGDLLYVSEYGESELQIYSYPQNQLLQTIKNVVYYPDGECTDAAGDVYVANTARDYVSEFAHGGTSPIASFVDKHRHPVTCSVDPTTGKLAVTEYGYDDSIRDSIAIYSSPIDKPTQYFTPLFIYISCAYDPQGDLFVDGYDDSRHFRLVELPAGGTEFKKIALDKRPTIAGNLMWDGTYMTVSDHKRTIYRFSISGRRGQLVGTTTILGISHGLSLYSIESGTLIVADVVAPDSMFGKGSLKFYNYPAGGRPTNTIHKLLGPDDGVVSAGEPARDQTP
jgi:DNA-binding beta-propeller fold protein YncE